MTIDTYMTLLTRH